MIIKAVYEPTNDECWINTDYIIDIFRDKKGRLLAYTFDNERGAYIIAGDDLEKMWGEEAKNDG